MPAKAGYSIKPGREPQERSRQKIEPAKWAAEEVPLPCRPFHGLNHYFSVPFLALTHQALCFRLLCRLSTSRTDAVA